jgi:hypothetical protein
MHTSQRLVLAAAVLLVVGCGKKSVAPTAEKKVTLAGKTATYHDWSKANPCEADPKMVVGDLNSTSDLLNEYLGKTGAGLDGVWSSEQVTLLEEGVVVLPPLLDATEKATGGIARNGCRFLKETGFSEPTKKAIELTEQARKRIVEAPAIGEGLALKAAIKAWKDKQAEARAGAKTEWCPPKLKAGAPVDIYYASEDEVGLTEWLFCDDARVFATAGAAPAFEAPAAMKKKPKDKPYLDSAANYPASDVQRAPHDPKKAAMAGDGGTPMDADGGMPADAGMATDAGT